MIMKDPIEPSIPCDQNEVLNSQGHQSQPCNHSQRKDAFFQSLNDNKKSFVAFFAFVVLLSCFYLQKEKSSLQQQITTLRTDYESHQSVDQKVRKNEKRKFDFLRQYQSQKFYSSKVEKIKAASQQDNFLQKNENARTSFLLSMNNFKLTHQNVFLSKQIETLLRNQYERLSQKYDFTLPEEPFCIFVPTINNVQNFRYEYNLRSIFNQNYSNYKVVIIDDASTDQNYEIIEQYLKDNPVQQEVILVKNKERGTAVPNIYTAATQYCQPNDIMVLVDGDDELLGINILKVFNSLYLTHQLEVLYSNFIFFKGYTSVSPGISQPYNDTEKAQNLYRTFEYTRMFPVRSFRVRNFLKIKKSDFQSQQGAWFKSAYDDAICTPLLQLSCGRNMYVDEHFYLYNTGIGNNDLDVDAEMNIFVANDVHYNKKRYECPPK